MLRLHVFGMPFLQQHLQQHARLRVVSAELGAILVAVQLYQEEAFPVRRPREVGEVAVGRVSGVQIDRLMGGRVVDAHLHPVTGHARHGIADGVQFAHPCGDVYQRIFRHHPFVHAVEGEEVAGRTPEGAFRDAELVAVHALSADHAERFVGDPAAVYVEVVLHGIGQVKAFRAQVVVGGGFFGQVVSAGQLTGAPVINGKLLGHGQQQLFFPGPRQTHAVEVRQFFQSRLFQGAVHRFSGDEQGLFSALGVDGFQLVYVGLDADISPPLQAVQVFDITVGFPAGDKVFQRGAFQCFGSWFLCHGVGCVGG